MNRVDRLFGIMTVLQSKKHVSAEHIAQRFEISVRTVYRDIKSLGEIGIPLSFEPNKGYFIVQGFFLPPVSFTEEEANALMLMGTISKKFGDKSIYRNYESALNKIKSMLDDSQKEKVEQLNSQTNILTFPSGNNDFSFLSEIQKSITDKTILKIDYVNNKKEESSREVEPIGLKYYSLDWHLIAWCWKRNEYRDFKTKHIRNLSNTGLTFRKKKHISLQSYMKSLENKIC